MENAQEQQISANYNYYQSLLRNPGFPMGISNTFQSPPRLLSPLSPSTTSSTPTPSSFSEDMDDQDEGEDDESVVLKFEKEIFLEELRKYRCIWDTNYEHYKDRSMKINSWHC